MRALILALAAAFIVSPAIASDETDVMAAVKRYDNGFNIRDSKLIVGMCSSHAIIIDEFPPHVWQGANACQNWLNDLLAFYKKNRITGGKVTLHKPWHVEVSVNRAYVVVPVKYTFNQNGKPIVESGSVWTLTLQKGTDGWLISGWAWAQH